MANEGSGGSFENQGARQVLTREQVVKAEKGPISHPAIPVLERNMPVIIQSVKESPKAANASYGSMADELVAAGPYNLKPADLISIWSRINVALNTSSGQNPILLAVPEIS